ncbi:MAG: AAA family ATPase [Verrucomicrobiales bacterium]|nr:AAA family ATPase [Verrucomicrobiales bacterium]
MANQFIRKLQLSSFLSFAPDSPETDLAPLNVLIGPNASGKSNFIEAIELLHATPTDFSEPIRIGGTAGEWLWKGASPLKPAAITARLWGTNNVPELRYRLAFTEARTRLEIVDEALEHSFKSRPEETDVFFYYRYQNGHPVINVKEIVRDDAEQRVYVRRQLRRETLNPEQSVLSQRKDPDLYPEITRVASEFGRMQIFREWSFGRGAALRQAQPATLPGDNLLPTLVNLGLVLNDLEHRDCWPRFVELMRRFLPRFNRITTRILAGAVQIQLFENNLKVPVPATRLSDGTIRFVALLAILLRAEEASLICIEEPELGLQPDAISILADLLVETSQKTQLIVTTHSDNLVSELSDHANSIVVCEHDERGTLLQRLEPERLREWLERYSLGELWLKGELGGVRW